jgi:hypothetical protein
VRRSRRLLAASLLPLVGIGAPATAWAAFTARASGTASATTLTLQAPATAGVTFTCPSNNANNSIGGVSITGWTAVTGATSYVILLTTPAGPTVTTTATGSSPQSLMVDRFPNKGTWTLTIVARVGTWTGPALSRSAVC